MKILQVNIELCTGCRRCETACSFEHYGFYSRKYSRIKVIKIEEIGIDAPVYCIQCKEKHCMKCPENALTVGTNNAIIIDREICTGCGSCASLCPVGAIDIVDNKAIVCDLCNGEPQCTVACNAGALEYTEIIGLPPSLLFEKSEEKKSPEEKRYNYVKKNSVWLRKNWKKQIAGD